MSVSRPASARPRSDPSTEHGTALPPTDEELLAIEDHRVAWTRLLGATVEEDVCGGRLVSNLEPGIDLSYLTGVRWRADEVEARLAEVVELMSDRGAWPSIVVSDGLSTPHDLAERLRTTGWVAVFSDRNMYARHPAIVPHLDPSLRVEAVTPASALECVRLEAEAFGLMPQAMGASAELLATSVADGTTRAYLLRLNGEPVASARLAPGPLVAGLHAIGVSARQRRRGYGRMITAIATRAGLATGHKLVWLSVLEDNVAAVNLYRSLGFEPSFNWTRWLAPA